MHIYVMVIANQVAILDIQLGSEFDLFLRSQELQNSDQ